MVSLVCREKRKRSVISMLEKFSDKLKSEREILDTEGRINYKLIYSWMENEIRKSRDYSRIVEIVKSNRYQLFSSYLRAAITEFFEVVRDWKKESFYYNLPLFDITDNSITESLSSHIIRLLIKDVFKEREQFWEFMIHITKNNIYTSPIVLLEMTKSGDFIKLNLGREFEGGKVASILSTPEMAYGITLFYFYMKRECEEIRQQQEKVRVLEKMEELKHLSNSFISYEKNSNMAIKSIYILQLYGLLKNISKLYPKSEEIKWIKREIRNNRYALKEVVEMEKTYEYVEGKMHLNYVYGDPEIKELMEIE